MKIEKRNSLSSNKRYPSNVGEKEDINSNTS